jgi:hypothetical protein
MLEAASATIAGIALVVSVIVFIDNRLRALEAGRLARAPTLVFSWDELRQSWILSNIGNGAALDVVLVQRIRGRWAHPLRMPEMAVQDRSVVPGRWVRWEQNPGLGARYRSVTGEQYMTRIGDDWSRVSRGWGDLPTSLWEQIEPHWRYRQGEADTATAAPELRVQVSEDQRAEDLRTGSTRLRALARALFKQRASPSDEPHFAISYRRADAAGYAGRLRDSLVAHFGKQRVSSAVDASGPGVNEQASIKHFIDASDTLVAVIGPNWAQVRDEHGRRQLDDPQDVVRLEIESALDRGLRVIPVLVHGARMPGADELPASLASLTCANAIEIDDAAWDRGVQALLAALAKPR